MFVIQTMDQDVNKFQMYTTSESSLHYAELWWQ